MKLDLTVRWQSSKKNTEVFDYWAEVFDVSISKKEKGTQTKISFHFNDKPHQLIKDFLTTLRTEIALDGSCTFDELDIMKQLGQHITAVEKVIA